MSTINFWPILISAIVSFGIGALWYSPILFGKEWMTLMKISDHDIDVAKNNGISKSYLAHFVTNIVSFGVLAFFISLSGSSNAGDGAFLGLISWLGFVAPIGISNLLWRKDSLKLVLIDSLQVLLSLIIGGIIIGVWK